MPASVGVQCVDCVREAQRTAPVRRSVLGAPVGSGRPVLTYTLIALCVINYALQFQLGWTWTGRWAFSPAAGEVEPWRFLTGAFQHGSLVHLLMNMYALWIVGSALEPMLGRWRYASLYLLSAVGGHVAVVLFATPAVWNQGTVGASGAVFGLFAAILLVMLKTGQQAQSMLVIIGINLAFGFIVPNISWQGHVGGLLTGALLGAAYVYAPRERRTLVGVGATALVAVALLAAVLLRYSQV